jgi:glycosyltransferase involved in cell wall biosynthesis
MRTMTRAEPIETAIRMTRPIRVLVPYIATSFGGVRRILGAGLPLLSRVPGLQVTYTELCRNDADMDAMERTGVAVERRIGKPGRSALSTRRGVRRALDMGGQVPRLCRIAASLGEHLHEYDVCYIHGHRELVLAVAARAASRLRRGPVIVWHWHGPPLSLSANARGSLTERTLVRLASRSCARVVAVSEFCVRQAQQMGVDPERLVTVLNAAVVGEHASEDGVQPLPERSPDLIILLVPCASVRKHKGVHVAIEAMRQLPRSHVLWVTGDTTDTVARAYVRELEELASRLNVSDRVRFIGARRDVHKVMAAADVVLVPSIWDEPFGLVAAEAQLLGIPVVASNRGALPELMAGGDAGILFDPDDPTSLAAGVDRLERDPDLRTRLSTAARLRATARYSYQRWTSEVASVLEEVARSGIPEPRPAGAHGLKSEVVRPGDPCPVADLEEEP